MLRWQRNHRAMLWAMPLLFALGCSHARQQTASPSGSEVPPEVIHDFQTLGEPSTRALEVPHHALPGANSAPGASTRRHPIAVAPMRTYGCCH